MLNAYRLVFLICTLMAGSYFDSVFGQIWLDNESIYAEAEEYLEAEDYEEALALYQLLDNRGIINANINYKIGTCYLNSEGKKNQSIPYLEGAVSNLSRQYTGEFNDNTAPIKALLSLGIAYRISNRYDKSIESFQTFIDSVEGTDIEQLANYYIKQVNNAKYFNENPSSHKLQKIRDNSAYSLSHPVSLFDSAMFYMEEKPFYSAIVSGAIIDNVLIERDNLSPSIGTNDPLSIASITPDGQKLLFTAYVAGKGYELFYSEKAPNGKWGKYKAFDAPINSPYNEVFASITYETNEMYFSSNRSGGVGGNDIYVSRLDSNNAWGEPVNAGAKINTPFDEDVCYISADGQILFISSEGHLNMGGLDLFFLTRRSNGEWNDPVNLGSPVSTTDDDNFISVSLQNELFTSRYNVLGKEELYKVILPLDSLTKNVLVKNQLIFTDEISAKEVPYTITNAENNEEVNRSLTNAEGMTQNFLSAGTYVYEFTYDENTRAKQKIVVDDDMIFDELTLDSPEWEISKTPQVKIPQLRKTLVIKDVLFAFNSYEIHKSYLQMLDSIAQMLETENNYTINVEGHTDALGTKEYNNILSKKRARAVGDYLINAGVKSDSVFIIAKGEEGPVAINNNPDGSDNIYGRKYNRRVSIQIKKEGDELIIEKLTLVPIELLIKE
jgi:outer membrane protein OmpA-like peptidoglycan-associated protein/tetratricopeptide (TPR) repeat protein